MNRLSAIFLLTISAFLVGCGSSEPPAPPVMDAAMQEAISQEDQAVADAERNQ
ncbi:hypothetical protein FF011L_52210 [Roseimaritima multifibrata]|uniref:Uncharacterized protein n=1 Tax=Roseimaritima multifibrata TaxID=1930274 RepID=A0A517MNF6_9BACT|nr:hypothetical protein [Roseimaritima multifibrata]QDS96411.1 hypothetical protein FF011L_52210 [Roseimaritima multifibrata]